MECNEYLSEENKIDNIKNPYKNGYCADCNNNCNGKCCDKNKECSYVIECDDFHDWQI